MNPVLLETYFTAPFILPLSLEFENQELSKCILYMGFSALLFLLLLLFLCVVTLEINKISMENDRLTEELLNKKYNDMMKMHHYYHKLYSSLSHLVKTGTLKQIKEFFNRYIATECSSDSIYNSRELEKIQNYLLKSAFIDFFENAKRMQTEIRQFKILSVYETFEIRNIKDTDLFCAVSNILSNALEELELQEYGYINILLEQNTGKTIIKIENSLAVSVHDICSVYKEGYTTKQNHSGVGLCLVNEVLSQYRNVEHMTYLNSENLFVQQIIIYK